MTHQVLTGQLPFDADDVMSMMFKHTSDPAPPMSTVCPALPAALDAPVLHMMEKDPARRPQSLLAAVDALAEAAVSVGYAVQPSGRRALADPGRPSGAITGGDALKANMTPADLGKMVEARTMVAVDGAQKTLLPSEKDVKPGSSTRMAVYAGAAFVLLGGVGAMLTLRPPGSGAQTLVTMTATAAVSSPPAATLSARAPEPVATVSPVASTEVVPAAPAEIELTIDASPRLVDVYRGAEKLGTSAQPIRIGRSEGKVKLTFKAIGFAPLDVEVPAGASATVPVRLEKAAPAVKKPGKPEVEF
jgi:serine/threonine-protein kinase